MKKLLFLSLIYLVLMSCTSNIKDSTASKLESSADEDENSFDHLPGLCIWKEISVKETPSEKGKYATSIFLGEKIKVLSDTASETVNDKIYRYQRIKLIDGTEGWVRKEFIAVNAVPSAFISDAIVYKRPDLMTSTKKEFHTFDFVAVKQGSLAGWAEVVGRRTDDTWFTTGWVKTEHLTRNEKDVMFAVLYGKAMEIKDLSARTTELQNLLLNSDFQGSVFHTLVSESLGDQEEGLNPAAQADSTASY